MRFTKGFKRFSLPLLVLVLGLTGCASLDRSPLQQDGAATQPGADTASANPYLSQAKPVPAAARAQFEQAVEAMQAQQWQQARDLLQQMTQAYPELSGPYVNLGLVYRELGELERAKASFVSAIETNPLNGEAYNQLAILHREQGEFEQAEAQYLEALNVWPDNRIVHRNLGILYDLYMGRWEDALAHYRTSRDLAQEPNRRLEGWIVDLERRLEEQQAAAN